MNATSGTARRQNRAGNDNPILDMMRDEYYRGCDIWGVSTAWQFAIADRLAEVGTVPSAWEFTPSPFGADTEAPEYQAILEALAEVEAADHEAYLVHAGNVCDHLSAQARLAGLDY